MAFVYEIIDGKKVNAAAAYDFHRMNKAFNQRFGLWLIVSDGVRSYAEQRKGWLDYINGRTPIRWANPDSPEAYHVETNPLGARAIDIRDSGTDPGVTRYGNARSAWIRDNARKFNFNPRGYHEFNEPWHLEWMGTLATTDSPAGGGAVPLFIEVDGKLGPETISKLQSVVGARVDGEMGYETISKMQARMGGVKVDGELGPETVSRLQTIVKAKVDGDWGEETTRKLQEHLNAGGTLKLSAPAPVPAPAPAPTKLVVDGELGPQTVSRFQQSVGATVDGKWGTETTTKFQQKVGAHDDGILGPQTIRALQMNVGAEPDGKLGPDTVRKLQEFLNSGAPWKMVVVPPEAPVEEFIVTPRVPTLPFAIAGWNVPLGQQKRASKKITHYIIHHETTFVSQAEYYKRRNDRSNCPTWEVDGATVIEFAHPALKPSTTGAANEYSVASETVNISGEPDWKVAEASLLSHAKIAAWLSQQDFISEPDGTVVDCRDFKLDREHVIGHKEAGINATRCPGEYQMAHMDWIVEKAIELAAAGEVPPPVVDPIPATLHQQIAEAYRELGNLLEQLPTTEGVK
jgi:hypothetical protein